MKVIFPRNTGISGWAEGYLLKGDGVGEDPVEISGWEKVAETLLTEDVDYIDFTNLDIDTDGFYLIMATIINGFDGACNYSFHVNEDYVDTHAHQEYISIDGAVMSSGRINSSGIGAIAAQDVVLHYLYTVQLDPNGLFRLLAYGGGKDPASVYMVNRIVCGTEVHANITSMRFAATQEGGFGVGSRFIVGKGRTA